MRKYTNTKMELMPYLAQWIIVYLYKKVTNLFFNIDNQTKTQVKEVMKVKTREKMMLLFSTSKPFTIIILQNQ